MIACLKRQRKYHIRWAEGVDSQLPTFIPQRGFLSFRAEPKPGKFESHKSEKKPTSFLSFSPLTWYCFHPGWREVYRGRYVVMKLARVSVSVSGCA